MFVDSLALVMGLLPMHLGGLHPYEKYAVFAIAFGPFVVLALVVFWQRRRATAEEEAESAEGVSRSRRPAS